MDKQQLEALIFLTGDAELSEAFLLFSELRYGPSTENCLNGWLGDAVADLYESCNPCTVSFERRRAIVDRLIELGYDNADHEPETDGNELARELQVCIERRQG